MQSLSFAVDSELALWAAVSMVVRRQLVAESGVDVVWSGKRDCADLAWRIRVGDCRVIYDVVDQALTDTVVRASHRRDVYK